MGLCQIEGHSFLTNGLSPDSVVLDLGANLGRFSRAVIDRFGCRCYAVEPNPQLFGRIPTDPRLTLFNLAVAESEGPMQFHLAEDCEASSLLASERAGAKESIEVRAVRLEELLASAGLPRVDLIKMDIEGAEIQVLESCPESLLTSVPQITVEFHDFIDLTPVPTIERVVARMERLGFLCVRMWRWGYGDTLFINRRRSPVGWLTRLWTRHVTRNWLGLQRIVRRSVLGRRP